MNFFSSAVDRLETIAAALGAGLQACGELKNRDKCKAITREFINRKFMRRVMGRVYAGKYRIILEGGHAPPSIP